MKRCSLKGRKPLKRRGKPRFKKGRDEAFLTWIRLLSCTVGAGDYCGSWPGYRLIEAAHVRSRGAGGADVGNVVPLCTIHHAELHRTGIRSFEEKYGVDLRVEAERLAREYDARRSGFGREEARREMADWKRRNPTDRFRLCRYVREIVGCTTR